MTTDSTKAMTLEQVRDEMRDFSDIGHLSPKIATLREWLAAIDAHLAPREVSDEDVERVRLFIMENGKRCDCGYMDLRGTDGHELTRSALESIQADRQRGGVVATDVWRDLVIAMRDKLIVLIAGHADQADEAEASELAVSAEALLAQRGQMRDGVPAGWRINPDDSTGFIEVCNPKGEHIHIGYCPQASTLASQMLRDLVVALIAPDADAKGNVSLGLDPEIDDVDGEGKP